MSLRFRLAKARTLDEYGDAGYVLAIALLTASFWVIEVLAPGVPFAGPFLVSGREALREVLTLSFPNAKPALQYAVSLPALVAFTMLTFSVYGPGRRRFGTAFANVALTAAGALLGGVDYLFRRRTTTAIILVVLGVLLTLGASWQWRVKAERALADQAYDRWFRSLKSFVDSTSLSEEDEYRAQRLMEEWAQTKAETYHPAAAELIGTLQLLYGPGARRNWGDRIREVATRETKTPASVGGRDRMVRKGHQVILARARIRRAMDLEDCVQPESIDAAAAMFGGVHEGFDKSVAYGLTACYRCGLDHYLLPAAKDSKLKLCSSAVDCARGALKMTGMEGPPSTGACETLELKRRNNRLDLLLRLAVHFEKLHPMLLPEAQDKARLQKELDGAQKSLIECGQLYRLRDALALRTLAEARAASFTLFPQAPPTLSAAARGDVEKSGRWLVAASLMAPNKDLDWDMKPFCSILQHPEAKGVFLSILGETWRGAACPSPP